MNVTTYAMIKSEKKNRVKDKIVSPRIFVTGPGSFECVHRRVCRQCEHTIGLSGVKHLRLFELTAELGLEKFGFNVQSVHDGCAVALVWRACTETQLTHLPAQRYAVHLYSHVAVSVLLYFIPGEFCVVDGKL